MAVTKAFTRLDINQRHLDNINKMLHGLPKVVVADSVRRIMRQAGGVVRKAVQATAPRKTGALKRSFKVRSLPRSRTLSRVGVRVASYPKEGERYYANMVEYGWNPGSRFLSTTKRWKLEGEESGDMIGAHRNSLASRRVKGKFFFSAAISNVARDVNLTIISNVWSHISASVAKWEARQSKRGARKSGAA